MMKTEQTYISPAIEVIELESVNTIMIDSNPENKQLSDIENGGSIGGGGFWE